MNVMMLDFTEFVWAFLPVFYLFLIAWACIKKVFGMFGEEPIKQYLIQFYFCILLYILSVFVTRSELFEAVTALVPFCYLPEGFLKLMIYPLALVIAARFVDFRLQAKVTKNKHPANSLNRKL